MPARERISAGTLGIIGEGFDRAAAELLEQLWTLTYTDQGLRHQYIDQARAKGIDDYTLGWPC